MVSFDAALSMPFARSLCSIDVVTHVPDLTEEAKREGRRNDACPRSERQRLTLT